MANDLPQQRSMWPRREQLPTGGPRRDRPADAVDVTRMGTTRLTPGWLPYVARRRPEPAPGRPSQRLRLVATYQQEAARLRAEAGRLAAISNQTLARLSQLLASLATPGQQTAPTREERARFSYLQQELGTLSAQLAQTQRQWRDQLELARDLEEVAQRLTWEQ